MSDTIIQMPQVKDMNMKTWEKYKQSVIKAITENQGDTTWSPEYFSDKGNMPIELFLEKRKDGFQPGAVCLQVGISMGGNEGHRLEVQLFYRAKNKTMHYENNVLDVFTVKLWDIQECYRLHEYLMKTLDPATY